MNILQLIFKLLLDFVPMENSEYAKMAADGKQWYSEIQTDSDYMAKATGKELLLSKAKIQCEVWYMRALFAIAYLYGKRQLMIYTNPSFAESEEEKD